MLGDEGGFSHSLEKVQLKLKPCSMTFLINHDLLEQLHGVDIGASPSIPWTTPFEGFRSSWTFESPRLSSWWVELTGLFDRSGIPDLFRSLGDCFAF